MLTQLAVLESSLFNLETQLANLTSSLTTNELANVEIGNRITAISTRVDSLVAQIALIHSTIPVPPPMTL